MAEAFPDFFDRGEPLPFEDLFAPLVLEAGTGLREKAATTQIDLLLPRAHADWERYLLKRLKQRGGKSRLFSISGI